MPTVRRGTTVGVAPEGAFALWSDTSRWATFVDGFGHIEQEDGDWPSEGAKVVWRSTPAGRGVVTEKVLACEPPNRLATRVYEEKLTGVQTVTFAATEDDGSAVTLELEYELSGGGPFQFLTDVLFIRRAEGDALARTLRRFATEAAEQAAL